MTTGSLRKGECIGFYLLGGVAAAVVFLIDLSLPRGVAGGIPYIALLLLSLLCPNRRATMVAAVAASVLVVIDFLLSAPGGGPEWMAVANRVLTLLALWVVAGIILRRRGAEEALRSIREELENRVAARTAELAATNAALQREIAEREQAEQALRESKARYRGILEDQTDLICRYWPDGTLTYVNEAYCRCFGKRREELLGKSFVPFILPEDRELVSRRLAALNCGYPVVMLEHRVPMPDGEVRWQQWTNRAICGVEGQVIELQAVGRDVTERKKAETALRESEERFRNLVETASDWVWEVDERAAYTYVSPRVRQILGYEVEELLGRTPFDLMPPDEARRVAEIFAPIAAAREPFAFLENTNFHKSGHLVVLETSGVPFYDADGAFRGYRGVDRDVTERKRADERLRRREAELAHYSRLTTMGEMAAGLAHELNQPLAAIANYAGGCVRRLRTGIGAEPMMLLQALEQVAAEAVRAGDIIRHLREFVRKGETQRTDIDINKLITEALALVRPEARHKGVAIRLALAESLPTVLADGIQIEQVIVNLIRNAIEAMSGPGCPSRELSVRSALSEDSMVEVAVCDTGVGLDDEQAKQLFYPFFTTKPTGMGMGLSISYSIIEAHEGRLWASGNPEGGATFRFTLPVSRKGEDAEVA